MMTETLCGRQKKWELIELIGGGDAGEVWLAKEGEQGIECVVKRPSRHAYGSDVYRQAAQIAQEGRILKQIRRQQVKIAGAVIRPVRIKDDHGLDDNGGQDVFIVLEKARGFDFKYLNGLQNSSFRANPPGAGEAERFLLMFAQLERFPALLVYRMVAGVADLLDAVHRASVKISGKDYHGIVWNDVKLDHVFWDPFTREFTIIDWGNAQLLGEDGVSEDRRYSRQGDYQQFCEEIRRFLTRGAPDVLRRLALSDCDAMTRDGWRRVASAARMAAEQEYRYLQRLRHAEEQRIRQLDEAGLVKIQRQIIAHGEMPDETALRKHWQDEAQQALQALDWQRFRRAQRKLGGGVFADDDLFNDILQLASQCSGDDIERLHRVVEAVRDEQWPRAFWELAFISDQVDSEVLKRLRVRARARAGMPDPEKTPLNLLRRAAERLEENDRKTLESVIADWEYASPKPSPYWLQYEHDVETAVRILSADEQRALAALLEPLQNIASVAVNAWRDRNFEGLKNKLPEWLLYDPDRKRIVFDLPRRIKRASQWLDDLEKGPPDVHGQRVGGFLGAQRTQPRLQEWRQDLLERGRGLRIATGVAWLDDRLRFLEDWNKGKHLGELAGIYTKLTSELPWLAEYDISSALREFYFSLQNREYDKAQDIVNSSLKKYTGYRRLVGELQALENEIRGRTFDGNTLEGARLRAKADFHPKDLDWRQAYDLHLWLYRWYRGLGQKTLQQNWESLNEIHKKYSDWALVGAVKKAFGRWNEFYPYLAGLVLLHAWRLPEGNDLPRSYQEVIAVLRETLEWGEKCKQASVHDTCWGAAPQRLKDAQSRLKNWSPSDLDERLFKQCVAGQLEEILKEAAIAVEDVQRIHAEWRRNRENKEIESRLYNRLQYLLNFLKRTTISPTLGVKTVTTGCSKATGLKNIVWKTMAWGCGVLVTFCVFVTFVLVYKHKTSEPPPPTPILAMAADTPSAAAAGDPMQESGAQAFSSPSATMVQLTPTETAIIMSTLPPDAGEWCNNFRRWAAEGAWGVFHERLSVLSQDDYLRIQATCGWNYTYDQLQLEVGLLDIQTLFSWHAEISAEQRLRQLHSEWIASPPVNDILQSVSALDYAQWLRATLALCHLPDQLTETQRTVLAEYLPIHTGKFSGADSVMMQICGGEVSVDQIQIVESESASFIDLPDWPQAGSGISECAFQSGDTIRWKLDLSRAQCGIPSSVQDRPTWIETTALSVGFCLVDSETSGEFPMTFWLQRPEGAFGIQLSIADKTLQSVNLLPALPNLPQSNHAELPVSNLACGAVYKTRLVLQPVWVGNMLFWQVMLSDNGELTLLNSVPQVWPEAISEESWPVLMNEEPKLEFFWELGPGLNPAEDDPVKAHIYIQELEFDRRK